MDLKTFNEQKTETEDGWEVREGTTMYFRPKKHNHPAYPVRPGFLDVSFWEVGPKGKKLHMGDGLTVI